MILLRFLLLLAIAGVLILFTLSNWGVTMQLTFLGMRSIAFPLPLWILGAITAGILTTLVITALFGLTSYTARRSGRRTKRPPVEQNSYNDYSYTPPSNRGPETRIQDDWEEDASDWFDDSGDWTDGSTARSRRTDYEVRQNPKSGSRSGSTYSYTYRAPRSTPDPSQSVVDADYRVIIPPQRNLDDEEDDRFKQ
jgi:uncharacterized integral membrane protein